MVVGRPRTLATPDITANFEPSWHRRARAQRRQARAILAVAASRSVLASHHGGGMGKSKSWQCRSCHWSHDASHTSCFWCDKKLASSAPAKTIVGGSGGGSPASNRWSKWRNNKRQAAAVGKGTAPASNGKGFSAFVPAVVAPSPIDVDMEAQPGPNLAASSLMSVDEAKSLLALEGSSAVAGSLLAKARMVVDSVVVERPPAPPTAATLLHAESKLKRASGGVVEAKTRVVEAEAALDAAKKDLEAREARVHELIGKVEGICQALLGACVVSPGLGVPPDTSHFESSIGTTLEDFVRSGHADVSALKTSILTLL